MQVLRSKRAGFCMGVGLALSKLDHLVEKEKHVATFGPIIHNPYVLAEYTAKGVGCFKNIQAVKEALEPFYTFSKSLENPLLHILIRAHGIPKETESFLKNLSFLALQDATCPRVKDAQNAIFEATKSIEDKKSHTLLLYGDANHPEVDGLISYAFGKYVVSSSIDKIIQYTEEHPNEIMVLAAQTTQDRIIFDKLKDNILKINSNIIILDTICDATRLRQEEALELANKVDAMVVVGGKESGNTKRLAEIISLQNIPTILIENADELEKEFFHDKKIIGLTAGASTPKILVDEAEKKLLEW